MSRLVPILAAGEPSFTPSNYMPSVLVEIAFNAGYVTPAADRVWTDVTDYVELHDRMSITVGRQDERSTADANDLTLTLDNTDGRFTAGRSASPYYPNVKIGRPIRVSATVNGQAFIRFVGFVDEWPVEWDGTDAYASATIRATSRLARLGLNAKLRSMIEEEIHAAEPVAYWTLGDPSGSTQAVDSSGNLAPSLTIKTDEAGAASPVFGNATGPGTDGLTACEFPADSDPLYAAQLEAVLSSPAVSSWVCTFNIASSGATVYLLRVGAMSAFADSLLSVEVSTAGVLLLKNNLGTTHITGPSVVDGATHSVALTIDVGSSTFSLYLDGALVGTASGSHSGPSRLMVGGVTGTPGVTVSHVAAYDTVLALAQVDGISDSAGGFEGDRTDTRLLRILGWAGVASTEVDAEIGSETMTYQLTSGQSVVDALREVESTEGGVLFDGADGDVKFHNRSRRYQKTASATLDMASQHVGSDYAPKLDRSTLVNDATVDNPTTGETARSVDTTSSDEYGIATTSAKSVADSYDPLVQKASWLIASYAEPRNRVPSLTVDVLAHQGLTPSAETLLGITVGDLLAVTNAPAQSDTTSPSYFVEGYTETIGPESYEITFNLSPTYPTLNTFVIGDPVRGKLDSGNVIAY